MAIPRFNFRLLAILLTVALTIAALVVAFRVFDPTPPRTVVMSSGPAGSAYAIFAEQYREFFAASNIKLEIRESGGAHDNLLRLQEDSDVDVAFITMGSSDQQASPKINSLGTMFYEPMWFFYQTSDTPLEALLSSGSTSISIGVPLSRTNIAARSLFGMVGLDIGELNVHELEPEKAVLDLTNGGLDAAFFATSASTPIIKTLLANENLTLGNFRRADAYTALYPALSKLKVPAGVGDLINGVPKVDTNILSFTAILAVREDMHPAIQSLLIDAAARIHAVPDIFHASGSFPSQRVFNLPLSTTALRYYTSGPPFLQRYLPFWLAVLVKQSLVAILPLIGILYPAAKMMPTLIAWFLRRRINRAYAQLRGIELKLMRSNNADESKVLFDELDALDREVRRMRMPITYANPIYTFRTHINVVRSRFSDHAMPGPDRTT
jgi:TRAP-type uncharacterized transport system substrate-binding protein